MNRDQIGMARTWQKINNFECMKPAMKSFSVLLTLLLLGNGCALPLEPEKEQTSPKVASIEPGTLVGGVFSLGPTEPPYQSQEATWDNPDIVGVYIRLPWDSVHKGPGSFDFSVLDHELEQAVNHGKYVSLSFSAGKDDIPDWVFARGGVTPYEFQDGGSQLEAGQCGAKMTLGNPTDEAYQARYFELLRGVGEHLKTKTEWYNALAYVKISGANLFTHEFRLPNSCNPGCLCNTEVWARAGYTPEGIYAFVLNQMAVLQEVFPGKPMMFQLIQDGLPWVNDDGDYLLSNGKSSGGKLVRSAEQVEEIIARASEAYGPLFVVAHNGLQPDHTPNRWVTKAGKNGQPTAFQTTNLQDLSTPADLQTALENLWDNTSAHYVEAYERVLLEVQEQNNQLVPDSQAETNTLSEWNEKLQSRL